MHLCIMGICGCTLLGSQSSLWHKPGPLGKGSEQSFHILVRAVVQQLSLP